MYKQLLSLALLGSGTLAVHAEATGLLTGKTFTGETTYDKFWSLPVLYKDDTNPVLQEFSLQGRLQVQYADGDSNGHFDIEDYKADGKDELVWGDKFEARRARFGFKSKWFQTWKLEGQIDVDTDGLDGTSDDHTLYKGLYDLFVSYAPSDAFNASVGKTKVKLGREQEISSKEILTFERGLISNLLAPGELTGVWINGKGIANHWLYELGIYGNDRVREFSSFDEGTVVMAKIGYDYTSHVGWDSAIASLQYMHISDPGFAEVQSDSNFKASTSPAFTDSIALTTDIVQGRFGLTADALYGFGFSGTAEQYGKPKKLDQSDVFGITLIPSYFIADGLQLVGQFQWATSAEDDGLSLYGRYEKYAPTVAPTPRNKDTGDSYLSGYLGLNYYLYGHKLKLMNGIQYSHLSGGDYDGYTFLSGIRFSF